MYYYTNAAIVIKNYSLKYTHPKLQTDLILIRFYAKKLNYCPKNLNFQLIILEMRTRQIYKQY